MTHALRPPHINGRGGADHARSHEPLSRTHVSHALRHPVMQSHETPLLMAARGGHVDVCRDLLDAGADLGARDKVSTGL